jgi:phage-related protein
MAIAALEVFEKKTKQTPQDTIANCRRRYAAFKKEDTP